MNKLYQTATYLALSTVLGLSACGGANEAELMTSAKDYIGQSDYKAATLQLKNVLQKNPDSAEARFLLGKSLLNTGDAAGAEVELRAARRLRYAEAAVMPELAKAMLAQGEFRRLTDELAVVEFEDAAALADLKTTLATAFLGQGARDKAQASIDRALQLAPKATPARIMRARLLAANNDVDGALQLLGEVTTDAPGNASAWLLRGELLLHAKGDAAEAVAAYEKALALKPDLPQAHSALVSLDFGKRDFESAAKHIEAMKKALPRHPDTQLFEAQLAITKGNFEQARALLQKALQVFPEHPRLLMTAGAVELQLGATTQAEALLQHSVQLAPNELATRRLLAKTQLRAGQPAKALTTLRPVADTPEADSEILTLAGEAQLANGDSKAAEAYFTRALRVRPSNATARTALAVSQLAKGQTDTGLAELRTIAAEDKGASADMALISALLRRGDFDRAMAAIDGLEKKQPGQTLAPFVRGQALARRKDLAGARKNFEAVLAQQPQHYGAISNLAALDLLEKKPEQARARFDALLKADPKNVQALLALAELKAMSGGSPAEVTQALNQAVSAVPSDPRGHQALIDQLLALKDFKGALNAAQKAVAQLPEDLELQNKLGRAQIAAGENNQAQATFKKIISVQPKSVPGLLGMADTQLNNKDFDGAARTLKTALEVAPDAPLVQRSYVLVAVEQKRFADALAVARAMQTQRPSVGTGLVLEGEILLAQGQWDAAATAFRNASSKSGAAQAPARLHHALLQGKKTAEAARMAETWIKDHPKDLLFMHYLGDVALAQNDYATAEKRYREMLVVQPDQAMALNNVAWLVYKQGKPGALALAEKANAIAPNQPAFMDTMALILAAEDRAPEAIELQKQALSLAPRAPSLRLNLAKHYLQAGEKPAALQELEALAKLDKGAVNQDELQQLLAKARAR